MTPSPARSASRTPTKARGRKAPIRTSAGSVVDWLLEDSQPSVRYLTLTRLLRTPDSDPEVRATRARIPGVGWAADLLADQLSNGGWPSDKSLYWPKYLSTNWKLLVLSDLGITRDDPRIARACERWMDSFAKSDGGFGGGGSRGHLCATGNTVRALIRFGYEDEPRVLAGLDWMVRAQAKLGGWSCFASGRNLDSWEPLSAFAAYPRSKWTPEMERAVARGAEFFLSRELHIQGAPYAPWERFHYPVHYYYDLLVGLDALTGLGYGNDPRLGYALGRLRSKRRPDGRWNLDAVHPDVEGSMAAWFESHPRDRPTPLALEAAGQPSKMVTLTALGVLDAVERSARSAHGPS
jgi:hypothetical protein